MIMLQCLEKDQSVSLFGTTVSFLFKRVDVRGGLLYDGHYIVVAVVRRHGCIHHNGLRDRIATRSCRSWCLPGFSPLGSL